MSERGREREKGKKGKEGEEMSYLVDLRSKRRGKILGLLLLVGEQEGEIVRKKGKNFS